MEHTLGSRSPIHRGKGVFLTCDCENFAAKQQQGIHFRLPRETTTLTEPVELRPDPLSGAPRKRK